MLKRVLLRDAHRGCWLDFRAPAAVLVASSAGEVVDVLAAVHAHCAAGGWAAGYLAFEAAPGLESAIDLEPPVGEPLAVFALVGSPLQTAVPQLALPDLMPPARWRLAQSYPDYRNRIAHIRREIGRGSVYQVNYTTRLEGSGVDALNLFHRAAMNAPYGAWLELDDALVVSASPELFFSLREGEIVSVPMKGTASRGDNAADDCALRAGLAASEKERAENLMITDMVRNDLGRIADPGSVRAERLFEVHALPTVWQMTSTVRARTGGDLVQIFRALFPAASITGAPKIASLRMIRALEESPRGVYTGAIGYVGPGRTSLQAQFNVAIRTARVSRQGVAVYGAGGGIVWDSTPEAEYEEVCTKARWLLDVPHEATREVAAGEVELLETLRWSAATGFGLLDGHLERLAASAADLGYAFDRARVIESLAVAASGWPDRSGTHRRVRLRLAADGRVRVDAAPFVVAEQSSQLVMLAAAPVSARDEGLRHKTTDRRRYALASAGVPPHVEALLWNDAGRVTESVIANLVYEQDGRRFTPPVEDGLLPGVLRRSLIEAGKITERPLPVAELDKVDGLYLINALRGWRRAVLIGRHD